MNIKMTNEYKKAMVTGGAGFIGSNIIASLLKDGLKVISIDDYSNGKAENLQEFKNSPLFEEVNCDVTDYDKLKQYFKGVDIVFHQACSKNTVCLQNPQRDLEVNGKGTLNMLLLSKQNNIKKFVHASSGSVYGNLKYFPSDENHPLNPVSYYGVSKLCGEKYVRAFGELYGMDVTVLRYYHVYGPKQDFSDKGGVASIFIKKALENAPITIYGDGTQLRSFTYVEDVVNINKFVALTPQTKGEVYNCASGIKITIKELLDSVISLTKATSKTIYDEWKIGDIKYFDVSNNKLKELGFSFQYSFEQGLSLTIEHLRSKTKAQ